MPLRSIAAAALLTIAAGPAFAGTSSPASTPACGLASADRLWLDNSIAAWNHALALARVAPARVQRVTALVFDHGCTLTSDTAMTGGAAIWSGTAHDGSVKLPDGKSMPTQVTSFAAPVGEGAFFVMAAPSIWKEGGVQAGALTLEKMMLRCCCTRAAMFSSSQPTDRGFRNS
jgi:hypothetical protein